MSSQDSLYSAGVPVHVEFQQKAPGLEGCSKEPSLTGEHCYLLGARPQPREGLQRDSRGRRCLSSQPHLPCPSGRQRAHLSWPSVSLCGLHSPGLPADIPDTMLCCACHMTISRKTCLQDATPLPLTCNRVIFQLYQANLNSLPPQLA